MAWAGFDTLSYPGDDAMRYLWDSTPLAWTGFRLGPCAKSPDASWMTSYRTLTDQGWGVAPIYTGPRAADYAAGTVDPGQAPHDADEAAILAGNAGLPAGSTLFLDHEGEAADATPLGYIDVWLNAVEATGFKPGLRAPGAIAARFTGRDPAVALWVVGGANSAAHDPSTEPDFAPQPPPGRSSVTDAVLWRHTAKEDAPALTGGGASGLPAFSLAADFSSATMANPLTAASFVGFADPNGGVGTATGATGVIASPFPFTAVPIVITPAGPKNQMTLGISDALAAARTAGKIDAKIKIGVFDMTGTTTEYGGLDDEDMVFTASLQKITALAAAYALRDALAAAVDGVSAASPTDLIAAVEAAWGPTVKGRFAARPKDFPKLSRIFDVTAQPSPGKWDVKFKTDGKTQSDLEPFHEKPTVTALLFFERMLLMAQFSDNLGAGLTIQDLGFQYIMGTMVDLGLYDPSVDRGLWLSKDYVRGHWGTVPNFGGQRANAKNVAKYFAALGSPVRPSPAATPHMIGDGTSAEIGNVLDKHWTRSFIREGIEAALGSATWKVQQSKIGLYELSDLPAKFGPADEGGYFERPAAGGRTLKYALAILSGAIDKVQQAAAVVDDIILKRNTP